MLTQIHIRDLATIEELHLNFESGCTMITGETGAGKSVFIEAIDLALGGRASGNLVRAGKEKAEVSLCFNISDFPQVVACLKELDLYHDQPECIIRRIITSDGRTRCYVNGSPSTVQLTKLLGEMLFHLHGQHEQQVLLKTETQRDMLDRYADHLPLAEKIKNIAHEWKILVEKINELNAKIAERANRIDYLQFQLDELTAINLKAGEWELLELEHHKLTHSEELVKNIQSALTTLKENEAHDILTSMSELRKIIENLQQLEPKAHDWLTLIQTAHIQLVDLSSELNNYLNRTEFDAERTQQIEQRVSEIYTIARKHKVQPNELPALQNKMYEEWEALKTYDDELNLLQESKKNIEQAYLTHAEELTKSRIRASQKLANEVTKTIRTLSLPYGEFKILFEKDDMPFSAHGNEKVIFQIKTNPDCELAPLTKVISGGELSRLSLALHLSLACRTNIPTLVFDEIDTGLSGATAEKIGKLLRKLGESYQVFCITHQAQVAACGHHHLYVEKTIIKNNTHTRLYMLMGQHKIREIARMLAGETITKKTMEHANEILSK